MRHNDVKTVINRILEYVEIENAAKTGFVKTSLPVHFQGKVLHLFKVIGAALEVNYADFLDECRQLVIKAQCSQAPMVQEQTATQSEHPV
jgi:hypothetical protein